MLHLARLSIISLLWLFIVACAAVPRYLAGQGDPEDYSWQTYSVAPLKPRQPVSESDRAVRGGSLFDAASGAPPPIETPESAAAPAAATSKKSWSEDLKDCMAPDLNAGSATAGTSTNATIRRSEDSPMVQECMSNKGYRKVYRQWNF